MFACDAHVNRKTCVAHVTHACAYQIPNTILGLIILVLESSHMSSLNNWIEGFALHLELNLIKATYGICILQVG